MRYNSNSIAITDRLTSSISEEEKQFRYYMEMFLNISVYGCASGTYPLKTDLTSRGDNALRFHKYIHPYFQDKPAPAFRACEILQFFQVLVSRAETKQEPQRQDEYCQGFLSFESCFRYTLRYTKVFDLSNIHCK